MTPFDDPNRNTKTSYVGATYQVARNRHRNYKFCSGIPPSQNLSYPQVEPGAGLEDGLGKPGLSSASDPGRGYPPPVYILYLYCYPK